MLKMVIETQASRINERKQQSKNYAMIEELRSSEEADMKSTLKNLNNVFSVKAKLQNICRSWANDIKSNPLQ